MDQKSDTFFLIITLTKNTIRKKPCHVTYYPFFHAQKARETSKKNNLSHVFQHNF